MEGGSDLVALKADVIPVQVYGAKSGINLQRLSQQPGADVPHAVSAYVQHLLKARIEVCDELYGNGKGVAALSPGGTGLNRAR
jgi:hypothetical protein